MTATTKWIIKSKYSELMIENDQYLLFSNDPTLKNQHRPEFLCIRWELLLYLQEHLQHFANNDRPQRSDMKRAHPDQNNPETKEYLRLNVRRGQPQAGGKLFWNKTIFVVTRRWEYKPFRYLECPTCISRTDLSHCRKLRMLVASTAALFVHTLVLERWKGSNFRSGAWILCLEVMDSNYYFKLNRVEILKDNNHIMRTSSYSQWNLKKFIYQKHAIGRKNSKIW